MLRQWILCSLVSIALLPGAWAQERLTVAGGVLNLEWRGEFSPQEQQQTLHWLRKAAHTASQLHGSLPLQRSRVIIERADRGRGPVPWGQPLRRGMEGVNFHIDPSHSLQTFIDDWTAPHEFSHLFIPYPGSKDLWLSEGFASYYQNVLMAREGILTPEQAWQKLYNGFMRAEKDDNLDKTLSYVSEHRRQTGATMRVYWSGALYFLEADIALRQATDNQKSLDWVVEQFNVCCRMRERDWGGPALVEAFDRVADTTLFTDLYRSYSTSKSIPSAEPILEALGIEAGRPLAFITSENALREAIMRSRHNPL